MEFRLRHALWVVITFAIVRPVFAQPAPPAAETQIHLPPASFDGDDSPAVSATDLAKKLQNPVGDLISVPFQNNTNFNVGPHKGTQDILNIQPVIPIHLNQDWNLITRTILPLVWSPSFQPAASVPPFGLSAATFSAFLSPTKHSTAGSGVSAPSSSCRPSPTKILAPTFGGSGRRSSWRSWRAELSLECC